MGAIEGLFPALNIYVSPVPEVPGLCRNQSIALVKAVKAGVSWAAKMWDSKGKMQPGILSGNLNSLGNYDECLSVRDVESKAGTFSGQYCLSTISLVDEEAEDVMGKLFREVTEDEGEINMGLGAMLSKGFRWSFCIPSTCTASDLSDHLSSVIAPPSSVVVTVNDDDCSVLEDIPFTAPDYIFLVILFLLMVATLLSTCYDYAMEYLRKKNYWTEDELNITQDSTVQQPPLESDSETPPSYSAYPYSEVSGSSENPDPEAQLAARPDTLYLLGSRTVSLNVLESGHRDIQAMQRELRRIVKYKSWALESPVRDPHLSETDICTSFSLLSNGRYIFSFNDSRLYLTSLDGIKFISLCWVVLSHACYVTETLPAVNYVSIFKYFSEWPAILILNTQLAVDTFLVCTGVLISYNFFNDMNRRGLKQLESGRVPGRPAVNKIYILVFYLHRFIRLAPALAMMVLLQAGFLHHLGTGPFWKTGNGYLSKVCQETWWGTLLFVQNYINGDKLCLPHSWYAMVDFQLYLISPIILLAFLYLKRLTALVIAIGLICLGTGSTMFVNYYFDLPVAVARGEAAKWHLKTKYDYITAYTRVTPWMTGIIVGFLLHHYRSEERKKPYSVIKFRLLVIVGWFVALGFFAYSIFGMLPFTRDQPQKNPVLRAVYTSFSQTLWAFGIAWIIFACETGHGGILHESLSQRIFQPLQRLTYCTYLVHLPLMTHRALLTRLPIHVNKATGITTFFGDLLFSLHLALALCLLVEIPFCRIFKTISINYGFAVRFTEERYVTRRPSYYNKMWDAMNSMYGSFQQSGFTTVISQTYSALQRVERAVEPAQESGTESGSTNAPVSEETAGTRTVMVPTGSSPSDAGESSPITAALPAENSPSISASGSEMELTK